MEYFFLRFFVLFLFLFLFLKREFRQRKEKGLSPKNLSELLNMGSKWKKGSDPRVSALFFSAAAFIGFSLWEALVIAMLGVLSFSLITLPLGVVAATLLLKRKESFHPWTFQECQWGVAALALLSGAVFCWVLFPWVYFRSLFLKKR